MTDVNLQLPLELDAFAGPDLTAIHFTSPWNPAAPAAKREAEEDWGR
jgi:hypothetical protein